MAEETDHVKNYQLALRELRKANTCLKDMVAAVQKGGDMLQKWQTVPLELKQLFQQVDREVYPIVRSDDSQNTSKTGVDVSAWPSRDEIGKALSDQHKTLVNAKNAFARVPDEHRIGLVPPDSFDPPSPRT